MKYIAFLRSINVGGKNIIKMADLKEAVEKSGFTGVTTFIQSGNLIFESDETSVSRIVEKLHSSFLKSFNYNSLIIVKSLEQLKRIAAEIPSDWEKNDSLRRYLAFVADYIPVEEVIRQLELKEGIDFVEPGAGVLYMSTLLSGITRSKLTRLITKKVYQDITIRNYDTVRKILAIMVP